MLVEPPAGGDGGTEGDDNDDNGNCPTGEHGFGSGGIANTLNQFGIRLRSDA